MGIHFSLEKLFFFLNQVKSKVILYPISTFIGQLKLKFTQPDFINPHNKPVRVSQSLVFRLKSLGLSFITVMTVIDSNMTLNAVGPEVN